jgi:hypothetical protein
MKDQAIEAFNKWQRFHTRAKLDDLVHALDAIHRIDLVQLLRRRIMKPKRSLNVDTIDFDPRKKEVDDLNRKLNRYFYRLRTGAIRCHDTYVYSTMGLDRLRPVREISDDLE